MSRKLEEVFKELETRFVLNLGIEEISKPERLFFHLEQAWWFYEDQIADNHSHL
jgi:mRNA-decapping enzyme subunit 2